MHEQVTKVKLPVPLIGAQFASKVRDRVLSAISIHSYGQEIYYPKVTPGRSRKEWRSNVMFRAGWKWMILTKLKGRKRNS